MAIPSSDQLSEVEGAAEGVRFSKGGSDQIQISTSPCANNDWRFRQPNNKLGGNHRFNSDFSRSLSSAFPRSWLSRRSHSDDQNSRNTRQVIRQLYRRL